MIQRAVSPQHLDRAIEASLEAYVKVLEEKSPETDRQWLRSLLAPLEMNLVSNSTPWGRRKTSPFPRAGA